MLEKILKLVCSVVLSSVLVSCISTSEGGGLDLVALHNHLHPSAQAFSDAAIVVEPENPELAGKLRQLEFFVQTMDSIVEAYLAGASDSQSTLDAIDNFLINTQPLLAEYQDNVNVQLALIAVRQILSQVRLAIGQ